MEQNKFKQLRAELVKATGGEPIYDRDLAKALGVSEDVQGSRTIRRYTTGEREIPGPVEKLMKIYIVYPGLLADFSS